MPLSKEQELNIAIFKAAMRKYYFSQKAVTDIFKSPVENKAEMLTTLKRETGTVWTDEDVKLDRYAKEASFLTYFNNIGRQSVLDEDGNDMQRAFDVGEAIPGQEQQHKKALEEQQMQRLAYFADQFVQGKKLFFFGPKDADERDSQERPLKCFQAEKPNELAQLRLQASRSRQGIAPDADISMRTQEAVVGDVLPETEKDKAYIKGTNGPSSPVKPKAGAFLNVLSKIFRLGKPYEPYERYQRHLKRLAVSAKISTGRLQLSKELSGDGVAESRKKAAQRHINEKMAAANKKFTEAEKREIEERIEGFFGYSSAPQPQETTVKSAETVPEGLLPISGSSVRPEPEQENAGFVVEKIGGTGQEKEIVNPAEESNSAIGPEKEIVNPAADSNVRTGSEKENENPAADSNEKTGQEKEPEGPAAGTHTLPEIPEGEVQKPAGMPTGNGQLSDVSADVPEPVSAEVPKTEEQKKNEEIAFSMQQQKEKEKDIYEQLNRMEKAQKENVQPEKTVADRIAENHARSIRSFKVESHLKNESERSNFYRFAHKAIASMNALAKMANTGELPEGCTDKNMLKEHLVNVTISTNVLKSENRKSYIKIAGNVTGADANKEKLNAYMENTADMLFNMSNDERREYMRTKIIGVGDLTYIQQRLTEICKQAAEKMEKAQETGAVPEKEKTVFSAQTEKTNDGMQAGTP